MKYLSVLFLLFTSSLLALPGVSNVEFWTTHATMRLKAIPTDAGGLSNYRLEYGETTALGFATDNGANNYQGAGSYQYILETALKPNTLYYVRVNLTASSGSATSSCSSGQTGVGWSCDAATGYYKIQTQSLPANHGFPELPPEVDTAMPTFNGTNFPVTSDCANLQDQINACALAPKNLNHTISIPPAAICHLGYSLPAKTGTGSDTGTCTIRSAASDAQLPAEGQRASHAYDAYMPLFRREVYYRFSEFISGWADGGNGWRLTGLRFENEDPLSTYIKYPITNVVRNDQYSIDVTMNSPSGHPWSTDGLISIYGVTGFTGRGVNGTWRVSTWLASNAVRVSTGSYEKTGTFGPGTYSGGGFALMRIGNAITGVTNTTPPIVTTSQDHGISDEPAYTITSASAGVLTLAAGHGMDQYEKPIQISGSSVNAYNGFWNRQGVNGNSLTLYNAGALSGSSCSSNCGTVRVKRAIAIEGVVGATAVNGSHLYTVIDNTHISLDDVAASGAWVSGGILAYDPDTYVSDLSFGDNTSRNIVDRCIFSSAAKFPNRQLYGITNYSQGGAIIDSLVGPQKQWNPINPISNYYDATIFDARESISMFISKGNNQKIENNYIECQGICVFAEEAPLVKSGLILRRNFFYNNPVDMAGGPQSNGLYYVRRQHFELKQGKAVLIDGNVFDGGWVDATPAGAPMLFTPRAAFSPGMTTDITISNNTIKNTCSGIQISGQDSFDRDVGSLSARFNITNNLFHDLDCRKFLSNPSLTGGTVVQGYGLVIFRGSEDVRFTHNTVLDGRGGQPAAVQYFYGKQEGLIITDNIMISHDANGAGMLGGAGQFGNAPAVQGTPRQRWDLSTYASQFSNNLLIPGVHDTIPLSNFNSTSTDYTVTRDVCEAYFAGFSDITCLGQSGGGDTANQRVLLPGYFDFTNRNLELLPTSAYLKFSTTNNEVGVDFKQFRAAQRTLLNPRVHTITATSAIIGYNVNDACRIEYSASPVERSGTTVSVGAGTVPDKDTPITSLTTKTVYYYWITCSGSSASGKFKTL